MISAEKARERSLSNRSRGQDAVRSAFEQQIMQASNLGELKIKIPKEGIPATVPVSTITSMEPQVMVVMLTIGEDLQKDFEDQGYIFDLDEDRNIIISWDL